ncbi:hypothetical protein HQ544_00280 [Candidatus Falkowbacteria bacterium]|nr:hypothetical protein [Candidatus Falkowbacteria bacterium]
MPIKVPAHKRIVQLLREDPVSGLPVALLVYGPTDNYPLGTIVPSDEIPGLRRALETGMLGFKMRYQKVIEALKAQQGKADREKEKPEE